MQHHTIRSSEKQLSIHRKIHKWLVELQLSRFQTQLYRQRAPDRHAFPPILFIRNIVGDYWGFYFLNSKLQLFCFFRGREPRAKSRRQQTIPLKLMFNSVGRGDETPPERLRCELFTECRGLCLDSLAIKNSIWSALQVAVWPNFIHPPWWRPPHPTPKLSRLPSCWDTSKRQTKWWNCVPSNMWGT